MHIFLEPLIILFALATSFLIIYYGLNTTCTCRSAHGEENKRTAEDSNFETVKICGITLLTKNDARPKIGCN